MFINTTGEDVKVKTKDGKVMTFNSNQMLDIHEYYEEVEETNSNIKFFEKYRVIYGFPEQKDDVFYIVDADILKAYSNRSDLVALAQKNKDGIYDGFVCIRNYYFTEATSC